MAKAELGTKRACPECGARFYDLHRNPATCPKCDHSFDPITAESANVAVRAKAAPETESPAAEGDDTSEDAEVEDVGTLDQLSDEVVDEDTTDTPDEDALGDDEDEVQISVGEDTGNDNDEDILNLDETGGLPDEDEDDIDSEASDEHT
jgi:uncharacterized protein (TIGR02300 family)